MAEKQGEKDAVIKKVRKGGHGGAHGGSWKVAYADFVTAMMAFFLLLWLLSMVAPEKRATLAEYFKEFNVSKEGVSSLFPGAGKGLTQSPDLTAADKERPIPNLEGVKRLELQIRELTPEQVMSKLRSAVEQKFMKLRDQIVLEVFEGGVRIQIVDKEGSVMFEPGSAVLTPKAREILAMIAENIMETANRIAVEGHTDSSPFTTSGASNWDMSVMRASAARRELEADGIDPYRIARVVGYADTEPYIKSDQRDARNRRISLILLYEKKPSQEGNAKRNLELGTSTAPP
ncbi:MAG: OmpA family protein [Nitrospinae bacterium]|nr:OmpA family protein [Nitrospinota bacterium]